MIKFKYWLMSVFCLLCVQQVCAQTVTVVKKSGAKKMIANVDSIQFLEKADLQLKVLKADFSSVKFHVNAEEGEHWVYALIPTDYYKSSGYDDIDYLSRATVAAGSQTIEIKDGDAAPAGIEFWNGKYSVKPGTAYTLLVAKAYKQRKWVEGKGQISWAASAQYDREEKDTTVFIPSYTDEVLLGQYLTKTANTDYRFEGFFAQQYFWTKAPQTSEQKAVVNVKEAGHTNIRFEVVAPEGAVDCRMLLLSDEEHAALLEQVGEHGLQASVLAKGEVVEGTAEFDITELQAGSHYQILVASSFNVLATIQSFTTCDVNTLDVNYVADDGTYPVSIVELRQVEAENVVLGEYRNENIPDPYNIDSFVRFKNVSGAFNFRIMFPNLPAGSYRVSAIFVPSAYHTELEKEMIDSEGNSVGENMKLDINVLADKSKVIMRNPNVSSSNEGVEKVALFENYEVTSGGDGCLDSELPVTLEFSVTNRNLSRYNIQFVNIYKLVIEPIESAEEAQ